MRYSALLAMCIAIASAGCGDTANDTTDTINDDAAAAPAGEQLAPPGDAGAGASADGAADDGSNSTDDTGSDDPAQRDDGRADDADGAANDDTDGGSDDSTGDDVATIPARFHGEWNADPGACGTGSSETRLRISADRIRFYESVGVVQDVDVESERVITVEAQYQGEGDTWSDERRLTLSADGNSLTVSGGGDLVRQRCP